MSEGRLLLVEDEEAVRQFSKRTLDNAGYRVLEATNGDDAEKLFAGHDGAIDLVVAAPMDADATIRSLREALAASPDNQPLRKLLAETLFASR